jgi:DnaJ-domain-containing protein 1
MTFSKTVIQRIVTLWGMGATAEETVAALRNEGIKIGLQTVYRLRHSLTAKQISDELLQEQLRGINRAEGEAQLRFRNELLKILIPARFDINSKSISVEKKEVTVHDDPTELLKRYDFLFGQNRPDGSRVGEAASQA